MHTSARVLSIWHEFHNSETGQLIFLELCAHIHRHFSSHLRQKNKIKIIKYKAPAELNLNWCTYVNISSFWCTAREEGKCKKKIQVIVNLPCLGYNTGKRKNTNSYLLVSTKQFMNQEVGIQPVIAAKPVSWILSCGLGPETTWAQWHKRSTVRPIFFRNYV